MVDADPVGAMFGPSTWPQVVHMLIAAYMVTGFLVASVYAVGMLRGRRDRYHRFGLLIPLTFAAVATPIQIGVGDWIANTVAENQPVKLAAMEGLFDTRPGVPLSLGGIYYDDELQYALEIPWGLSLLVHHDPNGVVPGLEERAARRAAAGQRRAPRLQHDGRHRLGAAAARARVRLGVVAATRSWLGRLVPARRRGVRRGGGGRDGGGLDHHRGRPPAVDRLRHPAHRRRREPGAGPLRSASTPSSAIYVVLTGR